MDLIKADQTKIHTASDTDAENSYYQQKCDNQSL